MILEIYQNDKPLGQLPVELPAPDKDGRIQYTGTIPLDAFTPGDYELRAIISDGPSKTIRLARFTVQP